MSTRREWIARDDTLAVSRQCALTGVTRSWVYAASASETSDASELVLLNLIDEQYTRRPFYGSRRMVVFLKAQGQAVNRKRSYCQIWCMPSEWASDQAASRSSSGGLSVTGIPSS